MASNLSPQQIQTLHDALRSNFGFNGVPDDGWHRYFPPQVLVSDGVKYLIEHGQGKGFIDIIASHQIRLYVREQRWHQHWIIKRGETHWDIQMIDFEEGGGPQTIQRVLLGEMDFAFDTYEVHLGYMSERECGICLLNEED